MNILFIVVDTLRASRLGAYGYPRATSPFMDEMAATGARFETCIAPGIPTTPAHVTMFTGRHPISHNVVTHGGSVDLDRRIPVLAEVLQQAGYTTAAVDNLYDLKHWFARGFEFYVNPAFRHKTRMLVSCEEINSRAIPWLRDHARERFFLFVHYWEPHTPYLPPKRYRTFYPTDRDPCDPQWTSFEPIKRQPFWGMFGDIWFDHLGPITDAEFVASLYDAEIRHVDDGIRELVGALDDLDLAGDTLVVLTGDHGESLYQHDIFFDHHGLYDDVIHVPLIARHPAVRPGTVLKGMATHMDLVPTLAEAAGAPPVAGVSGRSHWSALTGNSAFEPWERVHCCECTWQAKWAVRTATQKLILAREPDHHGMPRRELYDLVADRNEETNLVDKLPAMADQLEAQLESWLGEQLTVAGRTEDPLMAQGITLGRRWDDWLAAGARRA